MEDLAKLKAIARANIEANLGNVVDPETLHEAAANDELIDQAYVLAFDALADAGVPHARAREISKVVVVEDFGSEEEV